MNEAVLNIAGMSCGGCVSSVQNLLAALPGVGQVQVDLAAAQARIQFDPARISVDELARAVTAAGFTAHPV
ncbi:MAG: heavy-metal-associated domain-containing protein [Thiobacillus sp.]|nr:heavy-metal-associated domain-containing protein [Thiobacillus sp.]